MTRRKSKNNASGYFEAVLDNKRQDQQSKAKTNFKDSNLYQAVLTTIKATRNQIDKAGTITKIDVQNI